ncbi:hypothetical protein GLYMA_14G108900v4 [Glycine max]|uniref:Uncharacterized protein n=1 Tax=Glycine max TaxID=3847 RepID=K7M654_SOYBN|nr:hypothetical protein GYH30_039669 [Glycine max]KRH15752.1 hypothetical protein GLYMA_14G108900v4 [Glycine max]
MSGLSSTVGVCSGFSFIDYRWYLLQCEMVFGILVISNNECFLFICFKFRMIIKEKSYWLWQKKVILGKVNVLTQNKKI